MAETTTQPEIKSLPSSIGGALNNPIDEFMGNIRAGAKAESELEQKTTKMKQETLDPLIQQERAKRAEIGGRQQQISQQLQKPFQIPQETMADIASLGGMLAIVGPLLGSAGKQPASQAIAAMTGIMDGYQKGRKDLVDRSYKEFDANMKRLQALQKSIDTELAAYVEDAKLGRESALLHLDTAVALAKNGSLEGLIRGKSADSILKARQTNQQLAQSQQHHTERMNIEEKRYNAQMAAAKAKADAKTAADANRLPKTPAENDAAVNRYQTLKNLEDLDFLLNDPKYSKFITPLTKFTPEILQRMQKDFPELEQRLARMRAGEFLIGGKALTGNEIKILEPIFGWVGKNIDTLRTQIKVAKDELGFKQQQYEIMYPGLKNINKQFDDAYEKSRTGRLPSAMLYDAAAKQVTSEDGVTPSVTTPSASTSTNTPPAAYPNARLGRDPQGNLGWYIQKDGKSYKVQ